MDSKKLAQLCRDLAENRKAENVVVLDVRKLSSITDFFVIATGSSEPHLRAIESEIMDQLQEAHGIKPQITEGTAKTNWIVADFFDVIIHLMKTDVRERYDLEGLWSDAPRVAKPKPRKKAEKTAKPEAATA
ncbi:MAG TPA: ribosome silencing factor [Candidatus Limnocylindria bacterium]|jgi:ribosome-associated protein|nr:ribosome silencing factor [Candidatus Limnocylindria bacterium]